MSGKTSRCSSSRSFSASSQRTRVALLSPGADFFAAEAVNPDDPAMVAEHCRFQAAYLNGHPLDDPAANPLCGDLTGLPPILIQAASGDPFIRGAHELTERARRYGVPTTVEQYPVNAHDFQSFWSFLPEATDVLRQAAQFIRDHGELQRRCPLLRPGAISSAIVLMPPG